MCSVANRGGVSDIAKLASLTAAKTFRSAVAACRRTRDDEGDARPSSALSKQAVVSATTHTLLREMGERISTLANP